ncbi:hypothetical protein BU25DRAFT_485712 [Macroventuria anomochaeta]|uniref:Uncharacterized protein n=1 Tax=Macroventuria anomochaeta TaxID=301207 RepID=A0ACB6S8L9_9PLEO|nr:uncharacterized protein BU25DRAFT_485712 [Macroventuria anomochaeta]KAF2629699.1 hypothetical protein BU25DRAFT_485712 [Macroventuria anomochaeta]
MAQYPLRYYTNIINDFEERQLHDRTPAASTVSTMPSSSQSRPILCLRKGHLPLGIYGVAPSTSSEARPNLLSSRTSHSLNTLDSNGTFANDRRQPSMLRRLRSSRITASTTVRSPQRPFVYPSDFREPSEVPETRFIDSSGVAIPGAFCLSETMEYTTALADHGIVYSDHARLINAMRSLVELPVDSRRASRYVDARWSTESQCNAKSQHQGLLHSVFQAIVAKSQGLYQQTQHQTAILNLLLEEISQNLRVREVPVVVCVSSLFLFAPEQILEAHIEILHAPLTPQGPQKSTKDYAKAAEHLFFINTDAFVNSSEQGFSMPQCNLDSNVESSSATEQADLWPFGHWYDSRSQVRTRPWPL